ncbi:MAG: glycine zipper domain-containing protein [Thermodesulfobacteriota bacterium]|nr:glycine zipper domain-containing protein [Thermodesulfobacteriota bacterium]
MRNRGLLVCSMVIVLAMAGCTGHKTQVVPFKMPNAYGNAMNVAGATIAARAYEEAKEAKEAFGWDIRGAGLYPVQVIFDNLGDQSLEIEPSQTFLIDGENNLWSILDSSLAYDRVTEKMEMSRIAKGAVTPGLLSGAAGALVGAAIGIVVGDNVAESAGKGAAVGAAVGATLGGAEAAATEGEARATISQDLQAKALENKAISPHSIAHGFIFFPGEAKGTGELRMQLRVVETGELYAVRFSL